MAQATYFAQGVYEPTEDSTNATFNVGFVCKAFFLIVTDKTLVSGKRQIASISWVSNGGYEYEADTVSNATGSTIAAIKVITEDSQGSTKSITVNGNYVTASAADAYSGCKFMANKTYKWFAYA